MTWAETVNTAGSNSNVGVQAGTIRDSNITVNQHDPPERVFEAGVRYLELGVPDRALSHIREALAGGHHESPEARLYLVLAMLSKRSYRDLNEQNRTTLSELSGRLDPEAQDEWNEALNVVFLVLACVDGSGGDPDVAVAKLRDLPETQRELVMRHLSLVLTGSMKQGMWGKYLDTAHRDRTSGDRANRIWAYFEPEPAEARAERPQPKSATGKDQFRAIILAVATLAPLVLVLVIALGFGALFANLTTLVFVPLAAWYVARWHHHSRRAAPLRWRAADRSRPPLFLGAQVDRALHHYFDRFAPDSQDRFAWLEATQGVRRALGDEVTRLYHERDVRSGRVNWLLHFMARDACQRWSEGVPQRPGYTRVLATRTKVSCVALCLLAGVSALLVLQTALAGSLLTIPCVILAGLASRHSVPLWLRIHSERHRWIEESREREIILKAREEAREQWRTTLRELRPTEAEMEKWLEADKILFLSRTLRHYRLEWHEVVAFADLHAPDQPCRSAKVTLGPWRYSAYQLRVFLVTNEGVREATANLDFVGGEARDSGRHNYRFDAFSSVWVDISSEHRHTLNITLTNGPVKSLVVSEASHDPTSDPRSREAAAQTDLEATGFPHALRILEGIAAEGKTWFDRESKTDPGTAA